MRSDREDLTAQRATLTAARAAWAGALEDVAAACPTPDEVAITSRLLARALRSRAKTQAPVDSRDWAGEVSAAGRHTTTSDELDAAVAAARHAETAYDLAVYDLACAAGADG